MKLKYIVKIFVITCLIFGINNSFAEDNVIFIDMNKILNESKVGTYVEEQLTKTHEAKLEKFSRKIRLYWKKYNPVSVKNIWFLNFLNNLY